MKAVRCPYLGLKEDPRTALDFPAAGNFCHQPAKPSPVRLDYQESTCLTGAHDSCPVYKGEYHGAFPKSLLGIAEPEHAPRRRLALLALPLLLLLIAGAALAQNSGWLGLADGSPAQPRAVENSGFQLLTPESTGVQPGLTIPDTALEARRTACPTPSGWVMYEVLPTDSLYRLAVLYDTPVERLRAMNCMGRESALIPGTILYVPHTIAGVRSPTLAPTRPAPGVRITLAAQPTQAALTHAPPTQESTAAVEQPTQAPPTAVPPTAAPTLTPTVVAPTTAPTGVVPTLPLPTVAVPTRPLPQPTATEEPTATPDVLVIGGNNRTLSLACGDQPITVIGNKIDLTLSGLCSLTVTGNNNRITVPAGTPVINTGNGNEIYVY